MNKFKRVAASALAVAMIASSVPVNAAKVTPVKLKKNSVSLTIQTGETVRKLDRFDI
ncbi:MAG: hypothetical protein IKQ71_07940 [Lachnospiraceae bacterium]|nr:hypothetical protein [Lachnospiraceae bacterium]